MMSPADILTKLYHFLAILFSKLGTLSQQSVDHGMSKETLKDNSPCLSLHLNSTVKLLPRPCSET